MRKEIRKPGEGGEKSGRIWGYGDMWGEEVPIAAQYGILKGRSEQGTSVVFRSLESLMDTEAGSSEDLLPRALPQARCTSVMSRMTQLCLCIHPAVCAISPLRPWLGHPGP